MKRDIRSTTNSLPFCQIKGTIWIEFRYACQFSLWFTWAKNDFWSLCPNITQIIKAYQNCQIDMPFVVSYSICYIFTWSFFTRVILQLHEVVIRNNFEIVHGAFDLKMFCILHKMWPEWVIMWTIFIAYTNLIA